MLRVERHRLGLRLYVLRRRLHEWHLGLAVLVADAVAFWMDWLSLVPALVLAAVGLWLVAKDWADLTRAGRDTKAWRLGLHRRPIRFRPSRQLDDVPTIAAIGVALIAIIDLISATTRNVSWRGHALVYVEPVGIMRAAHALAVPVSFALLVTAYYLYRRRSRALRVAVALMAALTVFNLVKGLDVEEAAVTAAAAALLWAARSSFYVRHEPVTLESAVWRIPVLLVAVFAASLAAVTFAAPTSASDWAIVRGTGDLLLWQHPPFFFHDELAETGNAVRLTVLLALLASAYLLFRPLAAPRDLPDPELRHAAADLVRKHGADTLSFFKLRRDKQYLFNPEQTAFLGYRIESGVLVVSGDPVGEPDGVESLLRELVRFAEARALRIAALGVSPDGRGLFEHAGLRGLYLGDEAIVDTQRFNLEGRPIRKVRQSVSRLRKAGYATTIAELGSLDDNVLCRLEQIATDWRRGAPERGFAMAMDSLRNPHSERTLVVYATDEAGTIRGFLHFVPAYGRNAVSLSFMRRDHDTPNGLTEFLIVDAIEHLRARGIDEASLNFAAFARFIREPGNLAEKTVGRALVVGDTWFQIERLYRFNAKFFPRWEPRYFMYEKRFGLPRAGIAALWVEGQLPKPTLRRRHAARV
jgi:lysyl-tRNA synthetase, class II